MKPTTLLSTVALLATLTSCQTSKVKPSACADMPPYKGSAAFERMKSLAGKWAGSTPMGPMTVEYRVIAGGSVVEERFAAGTPMEMLSTYHDVDGKLVMTHYCMLRNQPKMRLVKSTPGTLVFDLAPTPGLNAAKDKHMHGSTYTFVDAKHLKVECVSWDHGKAEGCHAVEYTRL